MASRVYPEQIAAAGTRSIRGFEDRRFELEHDSLVVSSTTYDRRKGALSTLEIGTTLPDSDTSTTAAVAGNNYVTV